MHQPGSLDAVLANDDSSHGDLTQAPLSPSTTPPLSPTSGTPSFSWPRRVRSPEPHVPLRKASPQRLHNRMASPDQHRVRTATPDGTATPLDHVVRPLHSQTVTPDGQVNPLHSHPLHSQTATPNRQPLQVRKGSLDTTSTPDSIHSHLSPARLPSQEYHHEQHHPRYDQHRQPHPHHDQQQQQQQQLHLHHDQQQRHHPHPCPATTHTRRGAPHPLLIHTNSGHKGYAPASSARTVAAPYHSQVYAAPQRDDSSRAGQTYDGEGQRKVSWPLAVPSSYNQDQADHHNHRHEYRNMHSNDRGAPLAKVGGPLKTSRSMQEGLRLDPRDRLYHFGHESHSNGNNNTNNNGEKHSPTLYPSAVACLQEDAEEVRTSFRSALTSNSSAMDSTIGTSRSSVATAESSFSEYVKIERVASTTSLGSRGNGDESDFDVEDALDLYAAGFETPNNRSIDLGRRDSFPRRSIDSHRSALRPNVLAQPASSPLAQLHPSPLASNSRSSSRNAHRRSRSASAVDLNRLKLQETADTPLPTPGLVTSPTSSKGHVRTSTQIIAGREVPSAPPSEAGSTSCPVAPEPVPRDRYGFKKKSHYISEASFNEWERPYNDYLVQRRIKWDALMKKFGLTTDNPTRFPQRSDKVKKYIRKGIPPEWRGAAWFWYAGGPNKLAKDPGLYRKLLKQVSAGKLSDNDREHIERDLNRTFPDNIRFKPDPLPTARDSHTDSSKSGPDAPEPETDMVRALRRVLQAFAVHNPNIGYCQSLNFIAGLLLIFLDADEEKTFILLNVVTTEHLPGTHGVALEGANIDIAVLMASIRDHIPSVWNKLDDRQPTNSIISGGPGRLPTVSLATTAWFMSLFVGTLPIECVLRVWDCLFFEGSKTLFRVALAIFKLGEDNIKNINDPMEVFQEVQGMPRKLVDANLLMDCCFRKGRHGFGGLSQDVVERRREERRQDAREGKGFDEGSGGGSGGRGRGVASKAIARAKSRGRFRKK